MTTSKKNQPKINIDYPCRCSGCNVIGSSFSSFDLTKDKRYASLTSLNIIKQVQNPLSIKVYMQEVCLPIQTFTTKKQLLEEFQAYNSNIVFEFVDPLENEDASMDNKDLYRRLTPINITVDDKGKQSQAMVFQQGDCRLRQQGSKYSIVEKYYGRVYPKSSGSVQEYSIAEALNKKLLKKLNKENRSIKR
jgi:hypothetical protein